MARHGNYSVRYWNKHSQKTQLNGIGLMHEKRSHSIAQNKFI